MLKSPLIFGVALVAGWVMLAAGAVTALAGVAPVANPPHVLVVDTVEVIAPTPFDVADASVPNAQLAPATTRAEAEAAHAAL